MVELVAGLAAGEARVTSRTVQDSWRTPELRFNSDSLCKVILIDYVFPLDFH